MTRITRFCDAGYARGTHNMMEVPDGEWVRYDDIKHLLQVEPTERQLTTVGGIEAFTHHPSGLDTSVDLSRCPFCGHQAAYYDSGRIERFNRYVACSNTSCGVRTPEHYQTREAAALAWNRRDPNPAPQKKGEPSAPPELGRWGVSKADWQWFRNLFGEISTKQMDRAFAQLPDKDETDVDVCVRIINQLCTALNRQAEPSASRADRSVGPDPGIPVYATLRGGIHNGIEETHLECRFKDGQKYAAVVIDEECQELAALIMRAVEKHNEPSANLFATATYFNALKLEDGYEVTIRAKDISALFAAFEREHVNRTTPHE